MGHGLLKNRVAVVTGAGQGLGWAVAREFAEEGANVYLLEINPNTVVEAEAELKEKGYFAKGYTLDVTDYDTYASILAEIVKQWGRVNVLVNNAAITIYGTILEDNLEDWRKQITVNLEAYYMGTKLAAPYMVKQNFGRIINIASVQGFVSSGDCGSYNAAKGGIIALTKSMAVELGPINILVNAVAPGFMRSGLSIIDGVDETTTQDFIA